MNQWSFVLAAYGVTALATIVLVVATWRAMRRAEAAVDAARSE
ncbi:MAG: heme exporter protein CcmD [Sphingomonas bacterium]|nr:heme exporter protein CcmD [Sphingomonas bacterium]